MLILYVGDNLHERSYPVFWGEKKENIINLSSAELASSGQGQYLDTFIPHNMYTVCKAVIEWYSVDPETHYFCSSDPCSTF